MARLSSASHHAPSSVSPERGVAELSQLLRRLDQTILHTDEVREKRLRASEFERARLNSNLEYARSLLTRVEQETLHVKTLSRRQEIQADLNRKREILERLMDRMHDLEQLHEDDDGNSSDGEDILSEIIPTPSESMDSRSTDIPTEDTGDQDEEEEALNLPPPVATSSTAAPAPMAEAPPPAATETAELSPQQSIEMGTTTSQNLRSRGARPPSPASTSTATARAALFASRRSNTIKSTASGPATSTATAEAILDQQRAEQDALSESILKMASSLKASSQRFSNTLEQDKNVLSRAGEGMEKTERGMDAASRRMGTLRKMTEGKGWWGRMMLYAWVYGLMVALVLLVFVMPKLRF
nr:Protein transport protein use1 [Colletotrichum truncatum]KAF6781920.1 Protein transport protein use1 [Colletotrichum truncatum]